MDIKELTPDKSLLVEIKKTYAKTYPNVIMTLTNKIDGLQAKNDKLSEELSAETGRANRLHKYKNMRDVEIEHLQALVSGFESILHDPKKMMTTIKAWNNLHEACRKLQSRIAELEKEESNAKELQGVLLGAHEYLDKGGKIECGCKWHGDAEIALENTKPK